jgi:hypothetical protein
MLAPRKNHATLAVSATLEGLRWGGPVALAGGGAEGARHVGGVAAGDHRSHWRRGAVIRGRVIRGRVVVHGQKTDGGSHIRVPDPQTQSLIRSGIHGGVPIPLFRATPPARRARAFSLARGTDPSSLPLRPLRPSPIPKSTPPTVSQHSTRPSSSVLI